MKTISSKLLDDEKAHPPPPKEPEKVKYGTEKVNNHNIYITINYILSGQNQLSFLHQDGCMSLW